MVEHELPADNLVTIHTTIAMTGMQLLIGCNAREINK